MLHKCKQAKGGVLQHKPAVCSTRSLGAGGRTFGRNTGGSNLQPSLPASQAVDGKPAGKVANGDYVTMGYCEPVAKITIICNDQNFKD